MTSIPMSSPDIGADEIEAVAEVLRSGQVSGGPFLERFEREFADFIGSRHAVAVSGGTGGLHLCMIAAGVGEGDLVITTPYSFIASANCILYQKAVPVFVDVESGSGNIDPGQVAQAASDLQQGGKAASSWLPRGCKSLAGRPPRAILAVHALGRPAEMEALQQTARHCGMALIEDACEALGSECRGQMTGSLGDAAVFGFYANKPITTGEGGMVVTDRQDWSRLLRSLRNQGRDTFDSRLQHDRIGFNYRMDALSAALGLVQLGRIRQFLHKREQVACWYREELAGLDWIGVPEPSPASVRRSWFAYVIRVRPPAQRDRVKKELDRQGIPSRIYFPPIHLQKPYREAFGYQPGNFPVAEALGATSLALPFSGVMTRQQVGMVCRSLRSIRPSQLCCS